MADAEKELKIVITSETSQAEKDLGGFSSTLKQVATTAAGIGLEKVAESVLSFGKNFVTSSVESFGASQRVVAQLDAVLKSTKDTQAATKAHAVTVGISKDKHDELSKQLEAAKSRLDDLNHTHVKGEDAVYKHNKAVNETTAKIASLESQMKKTTTTMAGGYIPRTQMAREALLDLSKQLQSTTTYSDEAVLSSENLLLTFTNIGKDIFPTATKAVLDMSTAMGQDTKSSAIQLGKALQDPILGVSALRRVGVNFSEDQQNVIKHLVETGKTLDAQKMILKELETEFGGSAAAAAGTFQGKIEQLKNAFDDVKESIGAVVANALTPLLEGIKPIVEKFAEFTSGTSSIGDVVKKLNDVSPAASSVAENLGGVFTKVKDLGGNAISNLSEMWNKHKDSIMSSLVELLPQVTALWESIKSTVSVVMEDLGIVVKFFLGLIKEGWMAHGKDLILTVKGYIEIILAVLKLFFDVVGGIFKIFRDVFKGDWKQLWEDVKSIFVNIFDDVKNAFKGFMDYMTGKINTIKDDLNWVLGKTNTNNQKRALGGYASGMTLVGENGPELVNLPSGSYVNTNKETQGMLGGINITINNPSVRSDNDITALVSEIKRVLSRENELARFGLI